MQKTYLRVKTQSRELKESEIQKMWIIIITKITV